MVTYHNSWDWSPNAFIFKNNSVVPIPTTLSISTTKVIPTTNIRISIIVGGSYSSNSINITWIGNSSLNSLNFTMSSSGMTSGNYFSFGLSTDQSMVTFFELLLFIEYK
jgi:hypothetical protein